MAHLPTPDQLDQLAHDVVTHGFDPVHQGVADLVRAARRAGVRPVLADVLADPAAPRPVRERALGMLLVAIAACTDRTDLVTTGAASAA